VPHPTCHGFFLRWRIVGPAPSAKGKNEPPPFSLSGRWLGDAESGNILYSAASGLIALISLPPLRESISRRGCQATKRSPAECLLPSVAAPRKGESNAVLPVCRFFFGGVRKEALLVVNRPQPDSGPGIVGGGQNRPLGVKQRGGSILVA
jgi:hypothetical protein